MNWFEIYLWTRLNAINGIFLAIEILSLTILTKTMVAYYCVQYDNKKYNLTYYKEKEKKHQDQIREEALHFWRKIAGILAIVSTLILILLPTKEDVAVMYVAPKIMNSEIVKEIPKDLTDIYRFGIKEIKDSLETKESNKQKKEK